MPSEKSSKDKDKSKVHKLSLKGSARLVAEFVSITSPACFPDPALTGLLVSIFHSHDPVRAHRTIELNNRVEGQANRS